MKIKNITHFIILSAFLVQLSASAQDSLLVQPRLLLDFPLLELPHLTKAAKMTYNKRLGLKSDKVANPTAGDYLRSIESLSMQQTLAVTKNLHATNYYFQNKLWNRWVAPTSPKKLFINRLGANATSGLVDYVLAYYLMVLGPVWMHEEFHRNGLTHQGISSFNDTYYRFGGGGIAGGSVTKVFDEDMIRWKKMAPQDMIRSFAAGIESQYELVRNMRKDNFFNRTHYANVAMNVLITKQAVDYVNQFKDKEYDNSIDRMNQYGTNIADRDFVGWDFTPWVYDLFRPTEPYQNRGVHPSGNGINRAIKRSKLSNEEIAYLEEMGRLQYVNYFSPAMIGIGRIKLGEKSAFNFAARHLLTSFGQDLGVDLFLDIKGRQWFVGLNNYKNYERSFVGIEVEKPSFDIKWGKNTINMQTRAMLWLQPQDQQFKTTKAEAGGLLQMRAKKQIGKSWSVYTDIEAKTDGWVAGNPYLEKNFTFRTGLFWDIKK